ncbi:NADH dehydrogenase ubiquinone Fe-S protein 4 [Constrictibacter sp. MBR-5]|uniref:NADH dehydrogenase ubiquinone Fe-S protein 4 n=1 Tax=Constrictibacter sp. MBR-5 TaxID=3156467 RepID=UPI003399849D
MQAGQARTKKWVLEFQPRWAPQTEPLMGWTSSRDTLQQVKLTFPTKERAVDFAKRQGWPCTVIDPHERRVRSQAPSRQLPVPAPPATLTVVVGRPGEGEHGADHRKRLARTGPEPLRTGAARRRALAPAGAGRTADGRSLG